jgi:hypothetical protein
MCYVSAGLTDECDMAFAIKKCAYAVDPEVRKHLLPEKIFTVPLQAFKIEIFIECSNANTPKKQGILRNLWSFSWSRTASHWTLYGGISNQSTASHSIHIRYIFISSTRGVFPLDIPIKILYVFLTPPQACYITRTPSIIV